MNDDCRAAQTALDQGEALLRQSMTGAGADGGTSTGTLTQADRHGIT